MSNLENVLLQGIRADQPAAADVAEGSLYYVTDEGLLEQSLASAWTEYSDPAAGAGITALTGDVTATGPGSVAATIANDAVTDAKLRESVALSVIGRSANSTGNPADISTSAASAAVLRESGSVLGFGTIATAGIANGAVTGDKVSAALKTQQVGITVDGGGSAITAGAKGFKSFPVAGTITGWRLMADQAGDVEFDVTLDDFASFPPTSSIVAAAPPALSGVQMDEDTVGTWTTAVAAGDVFGFEVQASPTPTVERVTLELTIVVT